ncbi:hypothetical protein FEM08_02790 [Flavobacterium gilvum]|nr:hypothetical protein FEM08_02790 [Flavobacterium gilvum]
MVGSVTKEPRNEVRKKLFRQILMRSQKVAQIKYFVTNDEFLFQCQKAVETLRIYCEKKTQEIRKKLPLLTQEEIDDLKNGWYYIDMEFLIPETVKKVNGKTTYTNVILCNNDFKFIEECFENFSFEPLDRYRPEPPDLSNTPSFEFANQFDSVNETIVYEYFKKNLVDTKYLSANDLNLFLELAFEKMKIPQEKMSFNLKTQNRIVKIFYNYYKIIAGKPYGKQQKYLNLLRDYFIGFENLDLKNFSK